MLGAGGKETIEQARRIGRLCRTLSKSLADYQKLPGSRLEHIAQGYQLIETERKELLQLLENTFGADIKSHEGLISDTDIRSITDYYGQLRQFIRAKGRSIGLEQAQQAYATLQTDGLLLERLTDDLSNGRVDSFLTLRRQLEAGSNHARVKGATPDIVAAAGHAPHPEAAVDRYKESRALIDKFGLPINLDDYLSNNDAGVGGLSVTMKALAAQLGLSQERAGMVALAVHGLNDASRKLNILYSVLKNLDYWSQHTSEFSQFQQWVQQLGGEIRFGPGKGYGGEAVSVVQEPRQRPGGRVEMQTVYGIDFSLDPEQIARAISLA